MTLDGTGYLLSNLGKDVVFILNIQLHYSPFYSPNLNSIERLREVAQEQPRNNVYFKNTCYFKAVIEKFFTVIYPKIVGSWISLVNYMFQVLYSASSS